MQLLLRALEHPEAGTLQPAAHQGLVYWLEDRKIRNRLAKDRHDLEDPTAAEWNGGLLKYLKQLGCPLPESAPFDQQLMWLLRLAVAKEYEDNKDALEKPARVNGAAKQKALNSPPRSTKHPRLHLDESLPAVRSQLESLTQQVAAALGSKTDSQQPLPDELQGAQAAVVHRMLQPALDAYPRGTEGSTSATTDFSLGFSTSDDVVDHAAKLLRIMYTLDLRKLQSTIDETIVSVQEFTANPRTDSSLGKVGR